MVVSISDQLHEQSRTTLQSKYLRFLKVIQTNSQTARPFEYILGFFLIVWIQYWFDGIAKPQTICIRHETRPGSSFCAFDIFLNTNQRLLSVLNCGLAQITVVLLYHVWVSLFRICYIEDNEETYIKQFHPGSDQWRIFLKSV